MADEASFQFLHNEVVQYVYKSAENGETVRNTQLVQVFSSAAHLNCSLPSVFHSGEWEKYHQAGEHGFQRRTRANSELTS